MKTIRTVLFFVSLLVILGSACSGQRGSPTQPPPEEPVQVDNPTSPPDPTTVPPTQSSAPTESTQILFDDFSY